MFFISWRGYGWLVFVITFGICLLADIVFDQIYGDRFYENHKWPVAIALMLSGVACWFAGRSLNQRPARTLIDEQTGQKIVFNQTRNNFFGIPLHFWGPILALIGIIVLVKELAGK